MAPRVTIAAPGVSTGRGESEAMNMAYPPKSHRRRGLRAALAAGLSLASLLAGSTALAQDPTKADLDRARTLFQEGVALAAANNCAGALVKYKAVVQVKMTPQVAFNIAECEERL